MESIRAPISTETGYPGTIYGVLAEPGSYIEWHKTYLPGGKYAITGYFIHEPIKRKDSTVF